MKRITVFLSLVLVFVLVFSNCSKPPVSTITPGKPVNIEDPIKDAGVTIRSEYDDPSVDKKSSASDIRAENGLLIFKDQTTLDNTIQSLSVLNREQAIEWAKTYKFLSLYEVFNQINDAEDLNEAKALKGERVQPHSSLYYTKLKSKVIREIREKDDSEYWDYCIFDASVAQVVNEAGLIVINKKLYQYTEKSLKKTLYNGIASIKLITDTNTTSKEVEIIDKIALNSSKSSYNWSQTGSWQYWNNNKKRVRIAVVGYSSGSDTSIQNVTYNVNVLVQKKNFWGNWKPGDSTPCTLNSNWRYRFGIMSSTMLNCLTYYSNSLNTSPVNFSYPITFWPSINNLTINLQPNGWWNVNGTGYWFFCDAYNVYTYNFTGSVNGGPSGINFSLARP